MRLSSGRRRRDVPSSGLAGFFFPLLSFPLLFWILFLLHTFIITRPGEAVAEGTPWWDHSYGYREQLTIINNSASTLPSGYSVRLSLGHLSLVEAGKSLASGNDIRIVYWDGSTNVELDRTNESKWNFAGASTQVWFRAQADIAGSSTDDNYFLYYGNKDATSPPNDRKNIYEFFDDFSGYDAGQYDTSTPGTTDIIRNGDEQVWKIQSGVWNIENDNQADGTVGKVLSHDSWSGIYTYAYLLNRNYDNVLVEVKMRTKSGENGGYWPFGARLNTMSGANYTAWSYTDYTKILKFTGWSSPSTLVTGSTRSGMGSNWHTFKFALDGTKLKVYFDGVSNGCYVEDTTLTSGAIFATGSANRKIHFDDFKVRKYTTDEPSVSAGTEERASGRPTVTLDKKWRLKGDGHTPTDQYLGVSVDFAEAEWMPDAQAGYEIQEAGLSGLLLKTSSTTWREQIDISSLAAGTFHLVVTVADTGQQCVSDQIVFHVSYPFYHVWTIDWEGGFVARVPYLDSLGLLADEHGMPMSQLFNPRIYVWQGMPEWQKGQMTQWVLQRAQTKGDEIGLHLHMYTDYVDAAGVTRIMDPHWENRSDGYDVPCANYDYEQSLALLNFALQLFQARGLGTPTTFRAGGWFADEDNLKALSDIGFLVDASGCIYTATGSLPNYWSLGVTSQPYNPCAGNKNSSSCSGADWNLPLLEIPNNLSHTSSVDDLRPNFDRNYTGDPLYSPGVGTLLSHDRSGVGAERWMLEQYFAYVDSFLYVADKGAVIYATLADVAEALSTPTPNPPELLGAPELISGETIDQADESFIFNVEEPDTSGQVGYRIQISQTRDYDLETIIVDYVSELASQGTFDFSLVQPESTGTYIRGAGLQGLLPGYYYWRVMTIDSRGRFSRWSYARDGDMAFAIETPEGVGNGQSQVPAATLAISFCNPSGPNVFLKAQIPVAGAATLRVFSCSGRLIRTLPLVGLSAGTSSLYWDGKDSGGRSVSSGVYFVELGQDRKTVMKKLVLVK